MLFRYKKHYPYWCDNYLAIIKAICFNDKSFIKTYYFIHFDDFIFTHKYIFNNYIFKGLTTKIKGEISTFDGVISYATQRRKYIETFLTDMHFQSIMSNEDEKLEYFQIKLFYDTKSIKKKSFLNTTMKW